VSEAALQQPPAPAPGALRIGLVGSPNAGKTTLFNALTGMRARVGNYPGVTVERRVGVAHLPGREAFVEDLPGTYSLHPIAPDERVVVEVLAGELPGVAPLDALLVVADACTLERSLPFVVEVLRFGKPTCVVLTMLDELHARGGELDLGRLESALGVPVVGVVGHKGIGLDRLRALLAAPERWSRPLWLPLQTTAERVAWADSVLRGALRTRPGRSRTTELVDRVVLHPVAGTLLFAAVMVVFFQLVFAWAQPAMEALDAGFVGLAGALRERLPPGLATDFLADGLVAGVGSVVVFLPQIALLFALLILLEDLGYMARAAFVIDRVMGRIGLEGRCFVSLLSSYACAIPGIMATRSIPSERHRLVTILVSPLMTCSARLPVYALLIGAFVPALPVLGPLGLQGLVLLGLYLLGSLSALAVAAVLKRTLVRGEGLPFYLELPPYRLPTLRLLCFQIWDRIWAFLRRAGTIILGVSILLWVLLSFPRVETPPGLDASEAGRYRIERSFAGQVGHALEPLIAPLGFDWKIGVGLLSSLAAREVIIATLGQVYAATDEGASLREAVRADVDPRTGQPVFTPACVAALLVFFVFALQCMSTVAVMRRETNSWRWPAFAFGYLLVLAYGASFITYRVAGALAGA
jgi:ferrous iron transport protein B